MEILFVILIVFASLIVLLVLLAVFLRFHILLSYNKEESFALFFKVGFIKIKLYPMNKHLNFFERRFQKAVQKAEDKAKTAKEKPAKTKVSEQTKKVLSNLDILQSDEGILEKITVIFGIIGKTEIKIYVEELRLYVIIGTNDAAATAINVGRANALIYGALGVIQNFIYLKKPDIKISPDYSGEKFEVDFYLDVRFRVWYLLVSAFKIIKYLKENNETKKV